MFLFTTPNTREAASSTLGVSPTPVVEAIRTGAARSGVGFDYLLATAQRESALRPGAKAQGSSAAGLFQFIEQTWLGLIKSDGARMGLRDHASRISTRSDGMHVVEDVRARQDILALREDPEISALMAGAFTQKNRELLSSELGREPSSAELYMAHFLGGRGASELINAAQRTPDRSATSVFPDASAANRSIFYDREGRARTARELYVFLEQSQTATSAAPAFGPDKPLAFARADGPAFHGLFQSDHRSGPVSDAVSRLWRRGATDPSIAAPAFFPSSSGDRSPSRELTGSLALEETQSGQATPGPVPLPPPRPLTGARKAPNPLDLTQFTRPGAR
ncbi:lytic transglycosylase domain-containing protein [Microvirga massiliensis]|uniref:lytic transglycosylase domain-containing protein n=1 Tax=Microvirga massiliensis TaxID=1033741 RepID=UPI00069B2F94|nr:lytic transglycosylase domain-containing protein [Microvirga massiliensis]